MQVLSCESDYKVSAAVKTICVHSVDAANNQFGQKKGSMSQLIYCHPVFVAAGGVLMFALTSGQLLLFFLRHFTLCIRARIAVKRAVCLTFLVNGHKDETSIGHFTKSLLSSKSLIINGH